MDKKPEKLMANFGLIGKNIDYSFSKAFFTKKFEKEKLDHSYHNFDIDTIEKFPEIIKNTSDLRGLNVTIPYKEAIIPYLDKLNKKAEKIGAVNTIKITAKGKLRGYNTDYCGFKKSLKLKLQPHHTKALILGTGGASKAIAYALKSLNIEYKFVSRSQIKNTTLSYNDLTQKIIKAYTLIINCTPLGTYPNIDECPDLPYDAITPEHMLYDLIYNPSETKFLKLGKQYGAITVNGKKMLELQAKKSWEIWLRP